jgi:DNA invertase Pin-like site-specific DNA recombinase
MSSHDKIRPEHLARVAMVYVRQSTMDQVRHNHESRRRQYELADRGRALGWKEVVVIDDDLGKSGASSVEREGFQRLVAAVGLGQVGGVISIEVSRFARNNRDWYQLLDLCGLMDTLIVDADAVYDVRQLNDRLLLGLKGTMSEAELGWIRQRAHAGLQAKAGRGELVLGVPIGYVQTRDGRVERHPDQRVREAIELVFAKFTVLGSVRQVLLWFRQHGLELPVAESDGSWGHSVRWRLPVYNTILRVLQNPSYAGAYAFGRTYTRTRVHDGRPAKTRGHRRAPSEWLVLLRDHHEGYIAWATYERIQQGIAENAQMKGAMVRGAVRDGRALLAGLLLCGHCGRRLHIRYGGIGSRVGRYDCRGAALNHGTGRCISFGGLRVDEAVEHEILRVLQPAAIEAALTSADTTHREADALERALALELNQAQYEAERARRQYDAVEPENRLVAETLERRWNHALQEVRGLERRLEEVQVATVNRIRPDRKHLLQLAEDFPAVWQHPETDLRTKKQLLRLLIEDIVARLPEPEMIELVIHWKGGKHSILRVRKNRVGQHRYSTDHEVVDTVRELARLLPDAQIARVLNRLGLETGAGNAWTQARVTGLRTSRKIPVYDPATDGQNRLTMERAATVLGVSARTVRRMITMGILPARQPVPCAPWTIQYSDLASPPVQRAVSAVKQAGRLPQAETVDQLSLINSAT